MKHLLKTKSYVLILAIAVSFGCSVVSPTATFSNNSFSGSVSKVVDFDSIELKPTAQIGLIIDNSSSMQEEQEKMADGIEKMVKSLKGFNVDIFTISTTALEGTHNINTSGSLANISLKLDENSKYQYNPITPIVGTTDQYFSKPFMKIEDVLITDSEGDIKDYVPRSYRSLQEGEVLPWKIKFDTITLPSATNEGKPFQITADMDEAEVSGIASNIREEIRGFGTNGSPHNYGACALYKMARDMMPAGKTTSFFLISDEDDKSNYAIDTTAYKSATFEQLASNKLSYCSESSEITIAKAIGTLSSLISGEGQERADNLQKIINTKADGDASNIHTIQYKNNTLQLVLEYTGNQEVNGASVYGTYNITLRECLFLDGLCDLDFVDARTDDPRVMNRSEINKLLNFSKSTNATKNPASKLIRSIDSAKIVSLGYTDWGSAAFPYHTEDRRSSSFVHGNKTYSDIYEYFKLGNDAAGRKDMNHIAPAKNYARYLNSNGYFKNYKRTATNFADEGLADDLANGGTDFSNSLGDLFIAKATEKFPAFSFSAIIHDPQQKGEDCGDAGTEYGSVYESIANKVTAQNSKSLGKVNSICESDYDQYISDIKDSFIVKNASFSYKVEAPIAKVQISSLALIDEDGEKIPLNLTNDITKLDEHDVAAVGESVTFNQVALQKVLGIDTIDSDAFKGYKMAVTFSPIK